MHIVCVHAMMGLHPLLQLIDISARDAERPIEEGARPAGIPTVGELGLGESKRRLTAPPMVGRATVATRRLIEWRGIAEGMSLG